MIRIKHHHQQNAYLSIWRGDGGEGKTTPPKPLIPAHRNQNRAFSALESMYPITYVLEINFCYPKTHISQP